MCAIVARPRPRAGRVAETGVGGCIKDRLLIDSARYENSLLKVWLLVIQCNHCLSNSLKISSSDHLPLVYNLY